jgi:hypothetical protein
MHINLNHITKMEIAEAKTKIVELRAELAQINSESTETHKIYREITVKIRLQDNRKKDLSQQIKNLERIIDTENVFESVQGVEGFDTLLQEELVAISNGMDKTDYRKFGNYPRWHDLEKLVKEVIAFKKLYPGWILESLTRGGQYDTLPPQTFYRYTYKSPHGHYMSHGGIEREI